LRNAKSEPLTTPTPLPIFRLRQVVTSAVVWDGQTLVLSGGSMAFDDVGEKLTPEISGQKGATRLLRPNAPSPQRKSLLVFVTPTIIDPAGNRVHSPEDMPIRKNSVPPQKASSTK
jgi:type II secretory pathway component GspD/PulD (secretin)